MRTVLAIPIAISVFLLAAGLSQAAEIRTLVVDFGGDEQLGRPVATILDLQLWRTLRAAPADSSEGHDFGTGTVFRLGMPLDEPEPAAAAEMAKKLDISAQHVLWGSVFPIDKMAVVTAYLTLPDYFDFRRRKNERWSLAVSQSVERLTITADVPQRHYEFEPIVLPTQFVELYSTPKALPIMQGKGSGSRFGYLGTVFRHCGSSGDYACVTSAGKTGWVSLPALGKHKPEIVDFIGGIVRIYRSDWQGAIDLFANVVDNPDAPISLKIDSWLYIIRSKSELGLVADGEIDAVMTRAVPSRAVIQYAAMHMIHRCFGEPEAGRERAGCDEKNLLFLADLLHRKGVFAANDPWLASAQRLLHVTR